MTLSTDGKKILPAVVVLPRRGTRVYLVRTKQPPGWRVPAPDVQFGEHPDVRAAHVMASLGVPLIKPRMVGIESVVSGDWHLFFLYLAEVSAEPRPGPEYEAGRWFDVYQLPEAAEFAHGRWERDLVERLSKK